MLRSESIPVDYVELCRDFEKWTWPERRQRVRRRWGTSFYRVAESPSDAQQHPLNREDSVEPDEVQFSEAHEGEGN
jgi:hypothetical protein